MGFIIKINKNLTKGENLAIELFSKFDLAAERIVRADAKHADFLIKKNRKVIAVCEVKDIEDVEPSEATGYLKNEFDLWAREDNLPARIGNKVYEGWQQLKGYNSPKILLLVDFDSDNPNELVYALQGGGVFHSVKKPEDKQIFQIAPEVANGRIKDIKQKIDLYIWLDGRKGIEPKFYYYNCTGKELRTKFFFNRSIRSGHDPFVAN